MDVSVVGSFSITSFIDLCTTHQRSWYDSCELVEIQQNDSGNQIINRGTDITTFKRISNTSYLFGIMYDSKSEHEIEVEIDDSGYVYVFECLKERKKQKMFEVSIDDAVLTLYTNVKDHLYVDDYLSISSTALNHFYPIEPEVDYSLDIHEVSWKSFGAAAGYGSRNKLKKLMYPRYNKKEKE